MPSANNRVTPSYNRYLGTRRSSDASQVIFISGRTTSRVSLQAIVRKQQPPLPTLAANSSRFHIVLVADQSRVALHILLENRGLSYSFLTPAALLYRMARQRVCLEVAHRQL